MLELPLNSTYEYVVELAINRCTGNSDFDDTDSEFCRYCVNPICAINGIVEELQYGGFSETIINKVRVNALNHGLDLDDIQKESLLDVDTNFLVEVIDLASACDNFILCDDSLEPTEYIENTLKNLLDSFSTNSNIESLYAELSEVNWIWKDTSFVNHQKLNCIFENLRDNPNGNQLFCDTYSNFFGPFQKNLVLFVEDDIGGGRLAKTEPYGYNSSVAAISFLREYVDTACNVSIVKTILHEGIHAEFIRILLNPNVNISDYPTVNFCFENYDDEWHHECMANFYLQILAQNIKDYYGSTYTDEQYLALAWSGLLNTDAWNSLTTNEQNEIMEHWNDINNNCEKVCED